MTTIVAESSRDSEEFRGSSTTNSRPGPGLRTEDEVNIGRFWRLVASYKWSIFLITLVCTSLAVAYAFVSPPIYRAELLMVGVGEDKGKSGISALAGQLGGLASIAGIDLGGKSSTDEAMATLRSRAFTQQFVRDENLMPILFHEQWDESQGKWRIDDPALHPTMWDAFKIFDSIRVVAHDKRTGLITLSIEWGDPKLASLWANRLVHTINVLLRDRAIEQAQRSIDYLNKELGKTSVVELQQAIYRLIEAQINKIMLANVQQEYAFKVIDPAVTPEQKVKPNRRQIVFLGFLSGLIISVVVILLIEASPPRKRNSIS